MWLLSLRQSAVAAYWGGGSVLLFWAHFVKVATSTPQTTWGLFAVSPNVAELLTIIALCKPVVCFVGLHPDGNMAEVG